MKCLVYITHKMDDAIYRYLSYLMKERGRRIHFWRGWFIPHTLHSSDRCLRWKRCYFLALGEGRQSLNKCRHLFYFQNPETMNRIYLALKILTVCLLVVVILLLYTSWGRRRPIDYRIEDVYAERIMLGIVVKY